MLSFTKFMLENCIIDSTSFIKIICLKFFDELHSFYPLTLAVVQVGLAYLRVGCRTENRVRIFQEILGIF